MCILYNKRGTTYTMFFIIISALHVSGGISAHHQELIKLYVQPWVLSCSPVVYRWCGWVGCGRLCCIDYVDANISEKHAIFSFRLFAGLKLQPSGLQSSRDIVVGMAMAGQPVNHGTACMADRPHYNRCTYLYRSTL